MVTALIFAGGTGQRMNSRSKPKQFLELHGKPILIHTLEHFQYHPLIDSICIVFLKGWESELQSLLERYAINKVKWLVEGGNTGHESVYNGLLAMKDSCQRDDIVLIHDGVRPLINEQLITNNIETVIKMGNAITVEEMAESGVIVTKEGEVGQVPDRNLMRIAKAPQSFRFHEIFEVHEMAKLDGMKAIDSCHLMSHYNMKLYTVESTPYNIKIATPSDYYVFRALFEAVENSQIFGI